jgi:hypothetical protein
VRYVIYIYVVSRLRVNTGKESQHPRACLVIVEMRKTLSLLQFEPWTIQMVEQTLYTPRYPSSQNITLEQVTMMAGLCHFKPRRKPCTCCAGGRRSSKASLD